MGKEQLLGKKLLYTDKSMGDSDLQELFISRSLQHNIRVFALYYTRMTLERIAAFLAITQAAAEKVICDMVINDKLWARIDRLTGIVQFKKPETSTDTLKSW